MSNYTATTATKTVVTGVTITLSDVEAIEQFRAILTDAAAYGPMDSQPMARGLLDLLAAQESNAMNGGLPEDQFARDSRIVAKFIEDDRRVMAIKTVREHTGCGLVQAKNAVDKAYPYNR